MLKLGSINLDVPFFQASLSGYSDYAMRKLAYTFGCPLTFAGVMLAKSVIHPKVLRHPAFKPHNDEHPIGAQLLGRRPDIMAKAARELVNAGYDLIDLNFACPAPKVIRRQRGGFLLNEPQNVIEIYHAVRQAVKCPILMKLRTSFDGSNDSNENFWRICEEASNAGVDALIVHPRSVLSKFTGLADWKVLAELKRRFPKTTIIGSGDLFEPEIIAEQLKTSGIDGVVIARGAIGNPWIFRDLRAILRGEPKPPPPTVTEQGQIVRQHFEMILELYEPGKAVRYMRKFMVNYCKLHPQRKKAQKTLLAAKNKSDVFAAIEQWYNVNP